MPFLWWRTSFWRAATGFFCCAAPAPVLWTATTVRPAVINAGAESVSEAALRECREETGAQPVELAPRCVLPYISGRHQGLNFLFDAHRFEGEPTVAEPERFDDCCWTTREELPNKVAPWLADALDMPAARWYREFRWG